MSNATNELILSYISAPPTSQ